MNIRLLETGYNTGYYNMALDEVMLDYTQKTKTPVLRFYGWKPSCISLGYFQSIEKQVDLEKCKDLKVDVVRRITGGGTVYHKDELTYTIILPQENPLVKDDILESYKKICDALIKSLHLMGVKAKFRPLNDIVTDGKKISGNAQTRRKNSMLQHGTILLDVNPQEMFELLKVDDEKIKDKLIKTVQESVTSVKHETGKTHNLETATKYFKTGFQKTLNLTYNSSQLSKTEEKKIQQFTSEKYKTKKWINQR